MKLERLSEFARDIGAEIKRTYEGCSLDIPRAIMKELFHPITKEEIEEQKELLKQKKLHWEYHTAEDAGDIDHIGWNLCSDEDPRVIGETGLTYLRQAMEASGEIGDVKAVDSLIQVLGGDRKGDPDFLLSKAAEALGKIGDKRAIEPLVPLLKNESCTARMYVANALEKIGWQPKDDVEKAYYLVAKRDWDELVKLGKTGDEKVVMEPLIHFFKNMADYSEVAAFSEKIAETFREIGERMVEPLIQTLKNENSKIREGVAISLGGIGDKRAVDPLIHALKEEDYNVQKAAAEALGNIGDVRAVEPLIQVLKRYAVPPLGEIIEALGKIGDERAIEPLVTALEDMDLQAKSAKALGNIGDVRAVEPLIQVLKRYAVPPLGEIIEALGKIGDERAIEPLVQLLKNKRYTARMSAANALEKIGWQPKDDVEKANYLVAKRDWDELMKLGKAGDESTIQVLIWISGISQWPLSESEQEEYIRIKAIETLGEIGMVSAVNYLKLKK